MEAFHFNFRLILTYLLIYIIMEINRSTFYLWKIVTLKDESFMDVWTFTILTNIKNNMKIFLCIFHSTYIFTYYFDDEILHHSWILINLLHGMCGNNYLTKWKMRPKQVLLHGNKMSRKIKRIINKYSQAR